MKNLWRTSAEPLRVVLAPSPSLSVLFSDTASAIETTAPNHSFMPLWLYGGKIHHFWIESQGEGTTPFLVQAVAASRLRRSLHACIVAGFSGQTVYEERAQLSSSRHEARMTWGTGWGSRRHITLKLDGLQFTFAKYSLLSKRKGLAAVQDEPFSTNWPSQGSGAYLDKATNIQMHEYKKYKTVRKLQKHPSWLQSKVQGSSCLVDWFYKCWRKRWVSKPTDGYQLQWN